jgi:hypothetical protein
MLTEIVGYIARIAMHSNPFLKSNFLMYLVTLTIAPALLSAAIYLCLARIVVVYGEDRSRFLPRTYSCLFCASDFLALLLQAVGGAIASGASSQSTVSLVLRSDVILCLLNSDATWNQHYVSRSLLSSRLSPPLCILLHRVCPPCLRFLPYSRASL